jgi:hypothetical protein
VATRRPREGGTFGHHAEAAGTGERFEVRPGLDFARPEQLEGLEEIASAARVGEAAIDALGEPVPVRSGGALAPGGGVAEDGAQGLEKLETHFGGSARQRGWSDGR